MEKWIKSYEEIYSVDTEGNVYSHKFRKKRQLKGRKDGSGYLQVELWKDGQKKKYKIHRLIAMAFIPNPENKTDVNHINGIKTDNAVSNLEWNTRSENIHHAYRTGLAKTMKVICYDLGTERVEIFAGMMEASRFTGVAQPNISNCCKGKLKQSGGYLWNYM